MECLRESIIMDITEMKEMHQKIEEQKQLYEIMLSATPEMILLKDLDFKYVHVNKAVEDFLGITADQIIGKTNFDLFSKEHAQKLLIEDECVIKSGETITYEENMSSIPNKSGKKCNNKQPLTYMKSKTPVRNAKGEITGILISSVDITKVKQYEQALEKAKQGLEIEVEKRTAELKAANKQLKESRHVLNSIIENAPMVIWLKGMDYKYVLMNSYIHRFYKFDKDFCIGKTDFDIHPKEYAENFRKEDLEMIKTHKIIKKEIVFNIDGKDSYSYVIKFPLVDDKGEVYGICGIVSDITDRITAEIETRDAKNRAEKINKLKDEFLAYISHELRTPLSLINLNTNLLMKNKILMEKEIDKLNEIEKAVGMAVNIIDDILDISRIEAGELKINISRFDLKELLIQTVEEIAKSFEGKKIKIETDLNAGFINSDMKRITQIVNNLLSNAFKYTAKGFIKVKSRINENAVSISVSDSGRGIKKENIKKVFEPFFREKESKYSKSSLGLGLSICNKITKALKGTLSVKSELNKGSTFTLEIPAAHDDKGKEDDLFY